MAKAKKTAKKKTPVAKKKVTAKKAAPQKTAKKVAKKPMKAKAVVKSKAKPVGKIATKSAGKKAKPQAIAGTKKTTPAKTMVKAAPQIPWTDFMTPLDDRVLVRLAAAEKVTAGGLYIPDTVSDSSGNLKGEVVAIGRGHRDAKGRMRPMDVSVGNHVIFAEFSGAKMNLQNEDLVLLRESELLGVLSSSSRGAQ